MSKIPKKSTSGVRNPDRRNGKAWKKAKPEKAPLTRLELMRKEAAQMRRESRQIERNQARTKNPNSVAPRTKKKIKTIHAADNLGMKHLAQKAFGRENVHA